MSLKINFSPLLFLIVAASFFAGCKKDPQRSTTVTVSNVKSMITTSPTGVPDTVTYAYDSLGRQVRSQTDSLVTTYTYAPGSVTMTYMLAGANFTTTYSTNSAGLATTDTKGNVYTFNTGGYLTDMSYTSGGEADSTLYTIYAGNVDTSVQHQTDAATNNLITISYTYLPTIDSRNFGLAFLGKQNTNLISTETDVQVLNGVTYSINYTYSYTFDSEDRVSQQVQSSGTATYTTVYTYY